LLSKHLKDTRSPECCFAPPELLEAEEARGHLSLAEVGTEEFLQKLTSQITEMVSAKITQGERPVHVCLREWLGSGPGSFLALEPWKLAG
jgi:hypothetical protein